LRRNKVVRKDHQALVNLQQAQRIHIKKEVFPKMAKHVDRHP